MAFDRGQETHKLKSLLLGTALSVGFVFAAHAQDAAPPKPPASEPASAPPAASQLPEVTVETTGKPVSEPTVAKKPVKSGKKSVAAKKSVKPVQPVAEPSEASQQPGEAQTTSETAISPVDGYVATRSATSSKTDIPILETPRTVNVVTKDQIEAQAAVSIPQALRYIPGILLDKYSSAGVYDTYVVRGFEAPIYLDGLLLPADATFSFARAINDPFSFERIEVLKGPASALYGQAPPGGLINLVSKRPQLEPHNEVFFRTGSFGYAEAGIDLTGPVDKEGKLAYRLVGLVRDTDLQMDFTDSKRYFIAPSLMWSPDRDTSLTILSSISHTEGYGPQQYVPFQLTQKATAPLGRIPYSRYLGDDSVDHLEMDQRMIGYEFKHRFNSVFEFRQNLRYSEVENETLALRTEGLLGDGRSVGRSLNYVAGWTRNFLIDNQLQADFSTGDFAHKMLFGLDYQTGRSFGDYRFNFAIPSIDAYTPVYGVALPGIDSLFPFAATTTDLSQLGVYLQDQIKFDKWIVTLGGRFDRAETSAVDPLRYTPPTVPTGRVDIDDDAWTYFAGLSYVFDNGLAPYVSYSTSFQPANGFSLVNSEGIMKPTTGEGFEAGIKYQPTGTRLLMTAAYFDITQQNVDRPTVNPFVSIQTGEVNVEGVEFEIKASINDNLDIVGGVGHLKAKITDDPVATIVGNDFPSVAEDTASLWAMYTWREGFLAGFGLGAGVRYTGSQWAEATNVTKIPGYTLADLSAKYDFKYVAPDLDGLSLQLNVANLFDKYYVATCVTGPAYCGLGAERTIYGTLKYEW